MNYNNYSLGASVGTPQKNRQRQQQQQQQVTSPQSVMQNSPRGGNMNMNHANTNLNILSMYPNASPMSQTSNQPNANQYQFNQQSGQQQPQPQFYGQQQQQYQQQQQQQQYQQQLYQRQYQYQNHAPSPIQSPPPYQQQGTMSPVQHLQQFPQQTSPSTSFSSAQGSTPVASKKPYQHGFHPSIPSMQVSTPMSANAPSPQTTPTNQPIITTTPIAPRKGPRPTSAMSENALAVLAPTHDRTPSKNNNQTPNRSQTPSYASSNASSSSRLSSHSNRQSILDDPTFAPPPKFPQNLNVEKARFFGKGSNSSSKQTVQSTLPMFGMVKHSGEVMGRFSIKSMIIKKWRSVYWIAYGNSKILFFRSKVDFEEWVSNPYLKKVDRNALVKMSLDFVNDLHMPHLYGYKVTTVRKKGYNRKGMLFTFKVESWMDYGPMIAAAFASKNSNDVYCLQRIMGEMIETSPQKKLGSKNKYSEVQSSGDSYYDSDARSVRSGVSSKSNGMSVKSAPDFLSFSNSKLVIQSNQMSGYQQNAENQTLQMLQSNNTPNSRPTQYSMYEQPTRSRSKSVEPQKSNKRFSFGRKPNDGQISQQQFQFQRTDVDYAM